MGAIMEAVFCGAYLLGAGILGALMIAQSGANPPRRQFGLLTVILAGGDAFHLAPRIYGLLTGTLDNLTAALGGGTLVTSVTMTIFYLLLYRFWRDRRGRGRNRVLDGIVYGLAVIRIALCLFPQNGWFSAGAPLSWGIYRNIPFTALGGLVIALFLRTAKEDRPFRFAPLAVLLSFLFYLPVVLWADTFPLIGILMLPKTACYVWLIIMGYRGTGAQAEGLKQ